MKLVDTSDLKSDSYKQSIGSSPITSKRTKMMELVDMLGLGSSSLKRVGVQVPFLVKIYVDFNFRTTYKLYI